MRALVLAFQGKDDLPPKPQQYDEIVAYGMMSKVPTILRMPNLTIRSHQFGFESNPANEKFDYCYIRHPDPFGEPVPWMSAIAGIGKTVKGPLEAVFYHPYEVTAFHVLLKKILGAKKVKWESGRQVRSNEYHSRWILSPNPKQIKSDPHGDVPAFYAQLGPILLSNQKWSDALDHLTK